MHNAREQVSSLNNVRLASIVGDKSCQIHVDFIVRDLESLQARLRSTKHEIVVFTDKTHPVLDELVNCAVNLPKFRSLLGVFGF